MNEIMKHSGIMLERTEKHNLIHRMEGGKPRLLGYFRGMFKVHEDEPDIEATARKEVAMSERIWKAKISFVVVEQPVLDVGRVLRAHFCYMFSPIEDRDEFERFKKD